MNHTIGTCSICGGAVTQPDNWHWATPPPPRCQSCGAKPKQPHGAVIEMDRVITQDLLIAAREQLVKERERRQKDSEEREALIEKLKG